MKANVTSLLARSKALQKQLEEAEKKAVSHKRKTMQEVQKGGNTSECAALRLIWLHLVNHRVHVVVVVPITVAHWQHQ